MKDTHKNKGKKTIIIHRYLQYVPALFMHLVFNLFWIFFCGWKNSSPWCMIKIYNCRKLNLKMLFESLIVNEPWKISHPLTLNGLLMWWWLISSHNDRHKNWERNSRNAHNRNFKINFENFFLIFISIAHIKAIPLPRSYLKFMILIDGKRFTITDCPFLLHSLKILRG